MPIVRIVTPRELTWDTYNQVQARLAQDGPPDGLIVHTAVDNNGKPKIIDVWESEEQAQAFGESRLGPLIAEISPDVAGPPEPDQLEIMEIKSLLRG